MMRGQTLEQQIVAVLHDVVEDSDWTLETLTAEGFPAAVLAALDCLTRRPTESYAEFIDRVLTNPLATQVKQWDLVDNMTLTRLSALTPKDLDRLQKYHTAYQKISAALSSQVSEATG
jgi:(p)ppGpp synthase/HD superfamily hydrolase